MYAKCGSISEALDVFAKMKGRDVYSYTAMIEGFAMHGRGGEEALHFFAEMKMAGIEPNEVTLVGVLSVCSHAGLVEDGRKHFANMSRLYNISPKIEHSGCTVDMHGRAGLLEEAEEFIENMPVQPDAHIGGALLGACRDHNKEENGKRVSRNLLQLEPDQDGILVMSNTYASARRRKDAANVRKEMKMQRVKKTQGCSMIELGGFVYEFKAGNKSHPQTPEIRTTVAEMIGRAKAEGYSVLPSPAMEEQVLCLHSERLAIALGLISTGPGVGW